MAMFAVIKLAGKQFQVEEKDVIRSHKLNIEEGKTFDIKDVLLVHDGKTVIGKPYIPNASVSLKVVSHGRLAKVIVFKMKSKKRYKRSKNIRPQFTKVEVMKISA